MYAIIENQTGNIIASFSSLLKAKDAMMLFEYNDKEEGVFEENFYKIMKVELKDIELNDIDTTNGRVVMRDYKTLSKMLMDDTIFQETLTEQELFILFAPNFNFELNAEQLGIKLIEKGAGRKVEGGYILNEEYFE